MSDFNVRSDSVDVEQIMRQIRTRIREKRGADYTEAELQQLASVKLERFLDPRGVRSDLVKQFGQLRAEVPTSPKIDKIVFGEETLYETHRGPLRAIRRLLQPILKLFLNPNPLIDAMHRQGNVNQEFHDRFLAAEVRERANQGRDVLFYEVIHNLVLELTRAGIEVHNLKMRVESLSTRLDFDERRSRSLEGVVQYRPGTERRPQTTSADAAPAGSPVPSDSGQAPASGTHQGQPGQSQGQGQGERHGRRRRRRRRRRPGQTLADSMAGGQGGQPHAQSDPANQDEPEMGGAHDTPDADDAPFDDGPDHDGTDEPDSSGQ
jgi:hypothetical protein